MLPSESPFPCHWWGTSLDNVGLGDVRPYTGTYGQYEFERLPRLPFELCGDFAWLISSAAAQHSIHDEKSSENAKAFSHLLASAIRRQIRLPDAFTKFIATPELQQRVRSTTDCYLDICSEPIPAPIGDGWLVRFLADSQGCIFWYLYLTPDGADHAVVASLGFYGTEGEQWQDEPADPSEIVYCAESFEAFMCRFWLENEIWFAGYERTAMPDAGRVYIDRYRSTKS